MTKKGIVLSIILALILLVLFVTITIQIHALKVVDMAKTEEEELYGDFALNLTYETGVNFDELKSHGLPILIQIGVDTDDISVDMKTDVRKLNHDIAGKALVKYIDIGLYPELVQEIGVQITAIPAQFLIDGKGEPYKTTESEALGYNMITNESGNHVYTVHYGDLTYEEMKELLEDMR